MQIDVTIKGTSTLLLHKYPTATVSTKTIRGSSKDYSEEWIQTTYLNDKGEVVMPWNNIMACIFDGSKGQKKGKAAITRIVYTSLAIATLEPLVLYEGKPITIDRIKENDWLHISGAVVQSRRIDRIRSAIPAGYEISFSILMKPDSQLTVDDTEMLVRRAGIYAGLGDWRPSSPKKPGPYGTFEVISFKEVK